MSGFLIGGHPGSRFVGRECPKHRGTKFYATECPYCCSDRLAERIFGSKDRPSDEELFNREWAF